MDRSYSVRKHMPELLGTINVAWSNRGSKQRYPMLCNVSKIQNSEWLYPFSIITIKREAPLYGKTPVIVTPLAKSCPWNESMNHYTLNDSDIWGWRIIFVGAVLCRTVNSISSLYPLMPGPSPVFTNKNASRDCQMSLERQNLKL